jgi:tetratricopeptide (TPR) repeat protein
LRFSWPVVYASDELWQDSLSKNYFAFGYALWGLGDYTGQVTFYQQALEIQLKGEAINRALEAAHPERPILRVVADGLSTIGLTRWKCCRDLAGASRDFQEALERFQKISDADSSDMEARRDIANVHSGMAQAFGGAGGLPEALEADLKALTIYFRIRSGPRVSCRRNLYPAALPYQACTAEPPRQCEPAQSEAADQGQ